MTSPGRPPKYNEPMRQTAIWLPRNMADWLKNQPGTISDFVRKLVEGKMKNDMQFQDLLDADITPVEGMREIDLDNLERSIQVRRMQIMASKLELAGFEARIERGTGDDHQWFGYVLVYDPGASDGVPAEWATLDECRRLLDTARNLSLAEAYARWRTKIQPWEQREYTEEDARRDMRAERAELKRQFEAGEIDGEDYRLMHEGTRSYMDLARGKTTESSDGPEIV